MTITVTSQNRKSAVLRPSQLPCLADVPSVNLTSGCAHGCVYCYARSYSQFPGEGRVVVYADTADRLVAELARKRRRPTHVYFSPSTDVFQPVDAVQEMAHRMFSVLLEQGIGIAFVTKGMVPERHMALLCAHAELVQAQIGVITPDEGLSRRLEPGAPSPVARFGQMSRLIDAGVKTRVRVAPIMPGLTDGDDMLDALFREAAAGGVTHATINALHLRPAIIASIRKHLTPREAADVLAHYETAQNLAVCGGKSRQVPMPRESRAELFKCARVIASAHGVETHICGCMNPDLTVERCALAGEWPVLDRQISLLPEEV